MADRVELVLLDMTMPVMSGEETFRELRKIRPDIKVILSSGYNEVEAIRHFTGKGLAGFVQKPYTSVRLAQAVRSVLDRR
jgi:CheY-like chemotaxis protein